MNNIINHVYLSALDKNRFGIRVAKALNVDAESLPNILNYCSEQDVSMLIARCSTLEIDVAQKMEKKGFLLMDTLVYYKRDIQGKPIIVKKEGQEQIRMVRPGEERRVKEIAAEAFQGYLGHYHADKRLDFTACDEVYADWAYQSCISKDIADIVLVAELKDTVVGFAVFRKNNQNECECTLYGISATARRYGISRSLILNGMIYFKQRDIRHMYSSTQIINVASQKILTRLGFEISHSYYTFHKWFENNRN